MWDPVTYLDYADLRARPFYDLVTRIDVTRPRRVVDLGCGPGNLTLSLAERWPGATIDAGRPRGCWTCVTGCPRAIPTWS